jgi:hypothetical protein
MVTMSGDVHEHFGRLRGLEEVKICPLVTSNFDLNSAAVNTYLWRVRHIIRDNIVYISDGQSVDLSLEPRSNALGYSFSLPQSPFTHFCRKDLKISGGGEKLQQKFAVITMILKRSQTTVLPPMFSDI